jgi:hypothetical protein
MGFDEPFSGGAVPREAGTRLSNHNPIGFSDKSPEESGAIVDVAFLAV